MAEFYTIDQEGDVCLEIDSATDILRHGLALVDGTIDQELLGSDQDYFNKCCGLFKDHFVVEATVLAEVWIDLQTTMVEEARINVKKDKTCLDDFLIAAYFLGSYQKNYEMEIKLKKSYSYVMKWVSFYLPKVAALPKIVWNQSLYNHKDPISVACFTAQDDGPHYSYKFGASGSKFLTCLNVFENKCVYQSGPYPGHWSDEQVLERSGLLAKMDVDQVRGIGAETFPTVPSSYSPLPTLSSPSRDGDSAFSLVKKQTMMRHEQFHWMLGSFECLSQEYRHKRIPLQVCFEAVVVLCQYQLEFDPAALSFVE